MHRLRDDLKRFCQETRLPVVFTDLEPFDRESEYPDNTAFIGYDTGELGELAGRWLARQLQGKNRPHVLIIASHEHYARQQRCEQALRAAVPNVTIQTNDQCEFKRSRANQAVRVQEATALIDTADSPLRATVVQDTDRLAGGAIDILEKLHRRRNVPKRTILQAKIYETNVT